MICSFQLLETRNQLIVKSNENAYPPSAASCRRQWLQGCKMPSYLFRGSFAARSLNSIASSLKGHCSQFGPTLARAFRPFAIAAPGEFVTLTVADPRSFNPSSQSVGQGCSRRIFTIISKLGVTTSPSHLAQFCCLTPTDAAISACEDGPLNSLNLSPSVLKTFYTIRDIPH